MSLCNNCEGHTHTYCSTAPCGLMTCKGFRHKHYKLNSVVLHSCRDCINSGSELRYPCKHSGGLVPIECGSFEPKSEWINVKNRLPYLGARIKVKSKMGYAFSGRLTKLHTTFKCDKREDVTGSFDDIGFYEFSIVYWQPIPAKPEKNCDTCDTEDYRRRGFCFYVNKCNQRNQYSHWIPKSKKQLGNSWISVNDRLPEKYKDVRAHTKHGIHMVYWNDDGWWIMGTKYQTAVYSWQPLSKRAKYVFFADDHYLYFDDGQDVQSCIETDAGIDKIVTWLNAIWTSTGRHKKG